MHVEKIIEDIGETGINMVQAFKYIFTFRINWKETFYYIDKAGVNTLFILSITAIFIGLAMSTQLAQELSKNFGAQHLVGGLVAMATIRELAPVLGAIVVASKVGSSISAEIGSMKATEQIDALKVMSVDPIKYLLVPRLIALAITTPLLTVIFAILAIIAGILPCKLLVNLEYGVYLDSVKLFITDRDVYVMMLKAMIFGVCISILSVTSGFQAAESAEAVGNAATKTVVGSIIIILIFNFIITSLFFAL